MLAAIAAGAIIGLVLGILRTIEQTIQLLTSFLSIYELLWENSLAVLEVLIRVCTSDLPLGTLSTCRSDTPILGSGCVWLYPLDTVPTSVSKPDILICLPLRLSEGYGGVARFCDFICYHQYIDWLQGVSLR